jgi:hypothetical protein
MYEYMDIKLDDINTVEGVLQHVFISETRNPEFGGTYSLPEAERSFQAMKATIYNRLKKPSDFGAPGAKTIIDIITAPKQFQGYSKDSSGKVVIGAAQLTVITNVLKFANSEIHPRKLQHKEFVEYSINISKTNIVNDEFQKINKVQGVVVLGGVYAWNDGSAIGGRFQQIPNRTIDSEGKLHDGIIMKNYFWTLRKVSLLKRLFYRINEVFRF